MRDSNHWACRGDRRYAFLAQRIVERQRLRQASLIVVIVLGDADGLNTPRHHLVDRLIGFCFNHAGSLDQIEDSRPGRILRSSR